MISLCLTQWLATGSYPADGRTLKSQQHCQHSQLLCYIVWCNNLLFTFCRVNICNDSGFILKDWATKRSLSSSDAWPAMGRWKPLLLISIFLAQDWVVQGPLRLVQADALYGAYGNRMPPQFSIKVLSGDNKGLCENCEPGRPSCLECLALQLCSAEEGGPVSCSSEVLCCCELH